MAGFGPVFKASTPNNVILIKEIDELILDGKVDDSAWADATLLDFNFTFANGQDHRANVHLAHNSTHFFVGAILFHVGPNPFSVPDEMVLPDGFLIYFDVFNDGRLESPEDAKGLLNFIGMRHGQTYLAFSLKLDWFWDSVEYPPSLQDWHDRRPDVSNKILWTPDDNIETSDVSTRGVGFYDNGSTGDQHFEFCFPLSNSDKVTDGLQVAEGETRPIGFALEFNRQGYEPDEGVRIPDLYDFWPGTGFTPDVGITPSDYARLSFSSETSAGSSSLGVILIVIIVAVPIILWLVAKHK